MEASYQVLATALHLACPKGFTQAELVARLNDGSSNVQYNCAVGHRRMEGLEADQVDDFAVDQAMRALREVMTVPGKAPWSRCTFTLFQDGRSKFDVTYDD